MINITERSACCGCTACANICPHGAITLQQDAMGFTYPVVNPKVCTNCGLCDKVCAFHPQYDITENLPSPIPYGARHKNLAEIETSRSGAVFVALADWMLSQGGVIYGAGYKGHFQVAHKRATTRDEYFEFKGSKYVQSDMEGIFRNVREDLQCGKKVLFTGTPCQTAGLRSYIGKKLRNNLYLTDIICHGVPGPNIWRDYIAFLEKRKGSPIVEVNFRDKSRLGWQSHQESFKFKDDTYTYTYTYTFYKHIMFRPSCGNCPYCNTTRPSDITLADFWGWEKTDKKFNVDDKGCSLVLCNTEKGVTLFESVMPNLNTIAPRLDDCLQTHLKKPSVLHPLSNQFESDYIKYGIEYVIKKYCKETLSERIRKRAGRLKRKILRKIQTIL